MARKVDSIHKTYKLLKECGYDAMEGTKAQNSKGT